MRSDCKAKKGHSKKFVLPLLVYLIDARALQWKRRESCIAENMSASFRASYFWGNRTNISYLIYLPNTHMPKVMESLTILGCVEHIIIYSNLFAKVI